MRSCITPLLSLIAAAALMGTSCPMTMDMPPDDNPSAPTGNAADGQAKYNESCAACHTLGTFDTTGGAGDLKSVPNRIVNNLGGLSPAMTGITLNNQQIADLKAFIETIP